MKGKTLVKGHVLRRQGNCDPTGKRIYGYGARACSCGEKCFCASANDARNWHKQHKAEVLKAMEVKNG